MTHPSQEQLERARKWISTNPPQIQKFIDEFVSIQHSHFDGGTFAIAVKELLATYAQSERELQREADCAAICQFCRGECASRMTVDDEKAGQHRLSDEFGHEWFRDCVAKSIRIAAPTAVEGEKEL